MNPRADASNLSNQFLIAMPGMVDDNFAGAVVFVCEHSPRGALGLIINRPSDITVRELFERIGLDTSGIPASLPVLQGGPVQPERGFVLHEPTGTRYASSLDIPGGLQMTTSKDVLEHMAAGSGPMRCLIALGYSGWNAGQLEEEIGQNGWLTVEADRTVLFDTPVEARFNAAMALLGFNPAMLSQTAGHA
ncbi:YqgE/AlgH family protein [Thiomonas sp.]|jgi:putative transcriptional regulator|uniref:YqgE/AlgH family protein n=1 Tax=Thiomonas sp. TaxID=2047785 RepID=UPI0026338D44|nr:YqgE/AlgH family protein [Thiomonas sp.]